MIVNRLGAGQHLAKFVHADRQRDRKANRGEKRIAPAHAFGEGQHAGLVHAPFDRLVGRGGQRHHPPAGISDAIIRQPFQGAGGIGHGLDRGERLGGKRHQRGLRIAGDEGLLEREPVDIRDHMDIDQRQIAGQRVNRERRAERRAADADRDAMADLAQRAFVNRLDQHPHAGEQGFGLVDLCRRAATSQRAVGGGAAFGDIDDPAIKQRGTRRGKAGRLGQRLERGEFGLAQMGLGKVDPHAGFGRAAGRYRPADMARHRFDPGWISSKLRGQRLRRQRAQAVPRGNHRAPVLCPARSAHHRSPLRNYAAASKGRGDGC